MDDAHPDTAFLLRGLAEGFRLTSLDPSTVPPAELENYKSATNEHNFSKVEKQIIAEVRAGRYQVSVEKSKLISALGAVPQKDSADVRIIHDCSRPAGFAVNDYAAPSEKQSFQTLDDGLTTLWLLSNRAISWPKLTLNRPIALFGSILPSMMS